MHSNIKIFTAYTNLLFLLNFSASATLQIFPKSTKIVNNRRILPLSSYKTDHKTHKKLLFSETAIHTFKQKNFHYQNHQDFDNFVLADHFYNVTNFDTKIVKMVLEGCLVEHLKYLSEKYPDDINNLMIAKQKKIDKQLRQKEKILTVDQEIQAHKQAKLELAHDLKDIYFDSLFKKEPFHNLEIKTSSLSSNFLGLFTRDLIKKGHLLGNYVGGTMIFGCLNPNAKKLEDLQKKSDYLIDGARDCFDTNKSGNYLRFINHQKAANVFATSSFIPKIVLLQRKLISSQQFNDLPEQIETIEFRAKSDILPGQEVFLDYGHQYWVQKKSTPLRIPDFEYLALEMDSIIDEMAEQVIIFGDSFSCVYIYIYLHFSFRDS